MMLDTEYTDNMKVLPLPKKGDEPKLKQNKLKMTPFVGNYQSIYQDYVEHKICKTHKDRNCCCVTRPEMEEMLNNSTTRLMQEDPVLASQVLSTLPNSTVVGH